MGSEEPSIPKDYDRREGPTALGTRGGGGFQEEAHIWAHFDRDRVSMGPRKPRAEARAAGGRQSSQELRVSGPRTGLLRAGSLSVMEAGGNPKGLGLVNGWKSTWSWQAEVGRQLEGGEGVRY